MKKPLLTLSQYNAWIETNTPKLIYVKASEPKTLTVLPGAKLVRPDDAMPYAQTREPDEPWGRQRDLVIMTKTEAKRFGEDYLEERLERFERGGPVTVKDLRFELTFYQERLERALKVYLRNEGKPRKLKASDRIYHRQWDGYFTVKEIRDGNRNRFKPKY
jgi:hypothetical protein